MEDYEERMREERRKEEERRKNAEWAASLA